MIEPDGQECPARGKSTGVYVFPKQRSIQAAGRPVTVTSKNCTRLPRTIDTLICAISFWPGETISAMSVLWIRSSLRRSSFTWSGGLRPVTWREWLEVGTETVAGQPGQLLLHSLALGLPILSHLVIHPKRRRFVDGDDHRFPLNPPPRKCFTMSFATVSSRLSRVRR